MKYTSEEYEDLALEWVKTPAKAQVYATLALAAATAGENYRGEPVGPADDVYQQAIEAENAGRVSEAAKLYERYEELKAND